MQTLLLVGAVFIFTLTSMNMNRSMLNLNDASLSDEIYITGINFGQQLIDEICLQSFDENTTGGQTVDAASELTGANSLGPEYGETVVDDVDDFHGITYQFDSNRIEGFEASVTIAYADTTTPTTTLSIPSYLKRIQIVVKNTTYIEDSLTLERYVSYY